MFRFKEFNFPNPKGFTFILSPLWIEDYKKKEILRPTPASFGAGGGAEEEHPI